MLCDWCSKDMVDNTVNTCEGNAEVEYPDGVKIASSDFHMAEESGRCHDCNIKHGGKHHPGCDAERCPRCNGQLISCGCLDDEED